MLLTRLSPTRRARQKAERAYRAMLDKPIHRLIRTLLEMAAQEKMQAIGIGYRYADPTLLQHELESAQAQEVQSTEHRLRAHEELKKLNLLPDPAKKAAHDASATPLGPAGRKTLPLWIRINNQIYNHLHLPALHLGYFITAANELLVSLNGTPESPQPLRYIELEPTPTARRFIEVTLTFDEQNTFWITLIALQTTPPTAHISQGHY